jgi:hypothetical protein
MLNKEFFLDVPNYPKQYYMFDIRIVYRMFSRLLLVERSIFAQSTTKFEKEYFYECYLFN